MKFSTNMMATMRPPIPQVRGWLADLPDGGPQVIDLSQAAPTTAPHPDLQSAFARFATEPDSHLYGPVLGRGDLREAVARVWAQDYGAPALRMEHVAITAGCNQAFCAALAALAGPSDEVILAAPFYFNHQMRMEYCGIVARYIPLGPDMVPDPQAAIDLISPRTKAIVLVSPNNPTGAEYPPEVLDGFFDLAAAHGIALILDETYRNFRRRTAPAHGLFSRPNWEDVLIHLYSFSKDYRMTGHRVGALIAGKAVLEQVEKYLDTETICVNQLGQKAAVFALDNLQGDVMVQRAEMNARREAMDRVVTGWPGWRLLASGAYFAFVAHPFEETSTDIAKRMLAEVGILALPGEIFAPAGHPQANITLRIAFANVPVETIVEVDARMSRFTSL